MAVPKGTRRASMIARIEKAEKARYCEHGTRDGKKIPTVLLHLSQEFPDITITQKNAGALLKTLFKNRFLNEGKKGVTVLSEQLGFTPREGLGYSNTGIKEFRDFFTDLIQKHFSNSGPKDDKPPVETKPKPAQKPTQKKSLHKGITAADILGAAQAKNEERQKIITELAELREIVSSQQEHMQILSEEVRLLRDGINTNKSQIDEIKKASRSAKASTLVHESLQSAAPKKQVLPGKVIELRNKYDLSAVLSCDEPESTTWVELLDTSFDSENRDDMIQFIAGTFGLPEIEVTKDFSGLGHTDIKHVFIETA
jgi:hypothetical protein